MMIGKRLIYQAMQLPILRHARRPAASPSIRIPTTITVVMPPSLKTASITAISTPSQPEQLTSDRKMFSLMKELSYPPGPGKPEKNSKTSSRTSPSE